jgi:hypothetical protein
MNVSFPHRISNYANVAMSEREGLDVKSRKRSTANDHMCEKSSFTFTNAKPFGRKPNLNLTSEVSAALAHSHFQIDVFSSIRRSIWAHHLTSTSRRQTKLPQ